MATPKTSLDVRTRLIADIHNHPTISSLANRWGVTKQAMHKKLKIYKLMDVWKIHLNDIKPYFNFTMGDGKQKKISCVYSLHFIQNTRKKYYGSTRNLAQRIARHTKDLRQKIHYCEEFQKDFEMFGVESMKCTIIKICLPSQLLDEEKEIIQSKKEIEDLYNKSLNDNQIKFSI